MMSNNSPGGIAPALFQPTYVQAPFSSATETGTVCFPPSAPFPINALPMKINLAALEVIARTQAPAGMVVASLLTAASIAAQGKINVERMPGLISPVSLWLLTIAESGERKTTVDELFLKPIRNFEQAQQLVYQEKYRIYETDKLAWDVKQRALLRALEKSVLEEDLKGQVAIDVLKRQLTEHAQEKPESPKKPKLLLDDATSSAVKMVMHEGNAAIGIVSSEGASVINGRALDDLSLPNQAWSGSPLSVDRIARASFTVHEPRITLAVMAQPGQAFGFFTKNKAARDMGFLARFFISFPPSTQGTRFVQYPVLPSGHLDALHGLLLEILQTEPDATEKSILSFTPVAQERWLAAYNAIEAMSFPGQPFFNVRDYAAKVADNIARLAAIFHFLEGEGEKISLDMVERAIQVSQWFTGEFIRLFSPPPPIPQEQKDAYLIEMWIADELQTKGYADIKRNRIRQFGPNAVRDKGRLTAALAFLYSKGAVGLFRHEKTSWVRPNPQYFTPQYIQYLCAQSAMSK